MKQDWRQPLLLLRHGSAPVAGGAPPVPEPVASFSAVRGPVLGRRPPLAHGYLRLSSASMDVVSCSS